MGFGLTVRAKRTDQNIGLNDFAERLGVSPAYWSRVEREQENPPRDELVERAAAILGVRMDDLFVEAG
jgi:transcriptional regulator with XRE-family HTH domain